MHFKFLSKAIKKLSQFGSEHITESQMEKIYELTYKYQMLKQEMNLGDYGLPQSLSDRAYLTLHKIAPELEAALDRTYEAIVSTFEGWIGAHMPSDWYIREGAWENIRIHIFDLPLEELKDTIFADEDDMKEFIIDEFENYFDELEDIDKVEYSGKEYTEPEEEPEWVSPPEVSSEVPPIQDLTLEQLIEFIEKEDLEEKLRDAIMEQKVDYMLEEYEEGVREQWIEGTALGDVMEMKEEYENGWRTADLDEKIILFQKALTTMHNNGDMAEHVMYSEEAIQILNDLSSGRGLESWDRELTKTLGYPPSSRLAPKQEWFTSAMKRISKVVKMLKELCH